MPFVSHRRRGSGLAAACTLIVSSCAIDHVAAQPVNIREYNTNQAYPIAFCRPPNRAEINYWINDPRSQAVNSEVDAHRSWLRTNGAERQATIQRSYYAVFRRAPSAGEMQYWDQMVAQNGYTCQELQSFHNQYRRNNPSAR